MAPQPASMQTLANYLTTGYHSYMGRPALSWDSSNISVDISGLTARAEVMARAALQGWSSYANVDFSFVGSGGEVSFDDTSSGARTTTSYSSGGSIRSVDVNISQAWLSNYGDSVGTWAFKTFLHEAGHMLGLGHSGPYQSSADYERDALFRNDSFQATVMSYFSQDRNTDVNATQAKPITPMMADILAVQKLYGKAEGGPTEGRTTWGIGSDLGTYLDKVFQGDNAGLRDLAMTIWDEGGLDTLNFSNDVTAQVIDLRGGQFSSAYKEIGNISIMPDTVIENYVAGTNGDIVNGNAVGNVLWLRGGNDTGSGNGGNDVLHGGAGSDKLFGRTGRDALWGGDGADRLDGGAGDDRLGGNRGNDSFVFTAGRDTVVDFRNDVDRIVLDDALWGGRNLSIGDVLNRARTDDGDLVLDFGNGNVLRIDDLTNADLLRNDLAII